MTTKAEKSIIVLSENTLRAFAEHVLYVPYADKIETANLIYMKAEKIQIEPMIRQLC